MLKAVIFDKDGVLVDSLPLYFEAVRETFKPYGVYLSEEEFVDAWVAGLEGTKKIIDNYNISASFNAYTLAQGSYDSYDIEAGYTLGNKITLTPIIGFGYDNQRSFKEMKDGFSMSVGVSSSIELLSHSFTFGYRKRNGISYAYIGVRVRVFKSYNKVKRFF